MPDSRYSISAKLRIHTPIGDAFGPAVLTDEDLGRSLKSITVTNNIANPHGVFALDLAPQDVLSFKKTAPSQIVRPYSLCAIELQRLGQAGDPATGSEPVMLGLVDSTEVDADFSSEQPYRTNRIVGRSLAGILSDSRWWFHNYLASSGLIQLPDTSTPVGGPMPRDLNDEVALRTLGFLAIDTQLFNPTQRDPISLMDAAFRFFVNGDATRERAPFIKLNFQPNVPLASRLFFDVETARASFFDPAARLMQRHLPTQMPEASCWDLLNYFSGPPFNELYSDTFGTNVDDTVVRVISRKPPWYGSISYANGRPQVDLGNGSPRTGQSIFDASFGGWNRDAETVVIDGSDVLSMSIRRSVEGSGQIFNLYEVLPRGLSGSGGAIGDRLWQAVIPPVIDEFSTSPSFIQRYGVRPMRLSTKYIPILEADEETELSLGDVREHAVAYARLLREWFYRSPEFWRGTYVLKGRPALRVGKRLVDIDERREYYITAVAHRMTFGREPLYMTTVQVDRGWSLDGSELP